MFPRNNFCVSATNFVTCDNVARYMYPSLARPQDFAWEPRDRVIYKTLYANSLNFSKW